ncbi:MAG: DegV family protein [Anaerolineales bacterium]
MADIVIVTDSTCSMPQELIDRYQIPIVPQVVIFGEETLLDGVELSSESFYKRLATSEVMPTTSQATIGSFKQTFEPLVAEGKSIVAICLGSKLSGTMQSALQAKDMFPDADISIFDSDTVAMALGFQVLAAARAVEAGADVQGTLAAAEKARQRSGVILTVDTLEFLHRGGRIGGAARFLGTALNIKPLLEVADGRVEPVDRVRTRSKAMRRLVDILDERVDGQQPLRIGLHHTGDVSDAQELEALIRERFTVDEMYTSIITPAVGVHAGPGAYGLGFSYGV